MALPEADTWSSATAPAHPAAPLGVVEGVEARVLAAQGVELVLGQQQGERVLDGGDRERRRVALGQGDRPERRAGPAPVDEGALRVVDVGRPGAQDVEVVVVLRPGR